LNLKYIKIAEAVALDKTDQEICCAIWEVKDLREELLELIERKVKEEVGKICGRNFSSCFRASMASDLKSFSYEEEEKEFVEQCPILNRVITAAAVNERNLKRNKIKCTDQVRNAKLTGIGIILNARNREMNMHQMMTIASY
jgi:predicted house-cleaning noncanonical NTP pyrophosphatase (MazG superfamily)